MKIKHISQADQINSKNDIKVIEMVVCPFCGEEDFDLIGLKSHLLNDCENFINTKFLKRVF